MVMQWRDGIPDDAHKRTWGLDLSGSIHGAGGVGGLLAMNSDTAGNSDKWYFFDGNGNVTQLLKKSDSGLQAHYEYDPYGKIIKETGLDTTANPFRFSTKYRQWPPYEGADDLYYYGYRWYTPRTGRWLSRDPIGEQGGLNLYAFVGNGPTHRTDVLGMFCCDKCNPLTAVPKVTGFEVALGPVHHGTSPWAQQAANAAVDGAMLVNSINTVAEVASPVLKAFASGVAVAAQDLGTAIPAVAYSQVQSVYVGAITGLVNSWPQQLAAQQGVKIWVRIHTERCKKRWCWWVTKRYEWVAGTETAFPCPDGSGNTPTGDGFKLTETAEMAKAMPSCIRQALRQVK